jgi:hypothetical protein
MQEFTILHRIFQRLDSKSLKYVQDNKSTNKNENFFKKEAKLWYGGYPTDFYLKKTKEKIIDKSLFFKFTRIH